jgi:hypothetical protein
MLSKRELEEESAFIMFYVFSLALQADDVTFGVVSTSVENPHGKL